MGVSIQSLMMDRRNGVVQDHFAVIYAPKKKKRVSANCVEVKETEEQAVEDARPEKHFHAAVVAGPTISSESQYLYYLVRWLT